LAKNHKKKCAVTVGAAVIAVERLRRRSEKNIPQARIKMRLLGVVHLVHVADEHQALVGVTPLVVVPGNQLGKVVVELDARITNVLSHLLCR